MTEWQILLTGSTGFVGQHLLHHLMACPSYQIAVAERSRADTGCEVFALGGFSRQTDFSEAVHNRDVVIHCAGKAHTRDETEDALAEFREINVRATVKLAIHSARAGVKRFIFLSSIGVLGNRTGHPFRSDNAPAPVEAYAKSKRDAERHLRRIARRSGMEVIILRPPLIIGPSAPGNFGAFCRLIDSGLPLPLGSIRNQRSVVSVWTLADLIVQCVEQSELPSGPLLMKEDPDISTPELLRLIAEAKGIQARVFPFPLLLLRLGAWLIRKSDLYEKLTSSLQIDDHDTRDALQWRPPLTLAESLKRCFL